MTCAIAWNTARSVPGVGCIMMSAIDAGRMEVGHDGLRWASGGVLSVVRWRDRDWTPFFFRDIPPFGWNISLGGSDKGDDLTRPEAFLEREFLEETLVLRGDRMRAFVFGRDGDLERAVACAHEHLQRRAARDDLFVSEQDEPIEVRPAPTIMKCVIRDGDSEHVVQDVLVCINRLEAAIEVVRAVRYELGDDDYVLDGELLEPAGQKAPPDLIRMPVAMISHDYLRRAFGATWGDFEHAGTLQPSVNGPRMDAEDFVLFEPDVIRRRDIREGRDPHATPFERKRYADWTQRFGMHFYNDNDEPSAHDPCTLFTLPAAKLISYYFAHGK